jgi:dephospho-CoA kinase
MAHLVFVVGKSGMGKSTSLRHLDSNETLIINTDKKALPFEKFSDKYNKEKGNYLKSSNTDEVMSALKKANKEDKLKFYGKRR